ncbi:MAG TPA: DUF72 domain-containing protein [Nitrospiraceae bacterium]|nr:DUF72 domain-containing protein [Nitrospiraceae bacterium]
MGGRLLIGTSGWTYASWRGTFYPEKLPSREYLEFYAGAFPTTEINYSFYHLPKPQTYANWAARVPEDFLFAVKASRFITHIKRLLDVEEAWRLFIDNALVLQNHLGPILLQFPPSLKQDTGRLQDFLTIAQHHAGSRGKLRLVFEFRHESWFTSEVYRLLSRHGAALCIADSHRYPRKDVLTTDWAYVRFHGRNQLFASNYSRAELQKEARILKRYLKDGMDVLVYFNNDAKGYAVKNAKTLGRLLE